MRVLQLLKISYTALPNFLLLKIPLHLKILLLHNLLIIILYYPSFSKVFSSNYPSFSSKFTTYTTSSVSFSTMSFFSKISSSNCPPLLLKIHHLHNMFSIILHYVFLLQSLLKLPLLLKIHHLHNLFNIILHHVFLL
jgi:hypothetical protein